MFYVFSTEDINFTLILGQILCYTQRFKCIGTLNHQINS